MIANKEVEENSSQKISRIAEDLPRSARKVFLALIEKGPLKSKDLPKHTSLSSRGVRYGLQILRNQELVRAIPDFNDLRSHFYKAQFS
ncbi:MAG: hypothetical protein ACE5OZ_24850 [Candidatus Heimdallarchaeota archaeon]